MTKFTLGRIAFFIILFSLLQQSSSFAQETGDSSSFLQNKIVSLRFQYGFIVAQHPQIESDVTGHTRGFEIDFLNQADGSKPWQSLYHYPQTGLEFIYLNLANPQILGDAMGLLYIFNFPLSYRSDNIQSLFRVGTGLGWVTKTFDRVENNQNLLISTHLNASIQFAYEMQVKLAKNLHSNIDIGITHFSNGSTESPNLGINNGSASIGLNYFLCPKKINKQNIAMPAIDKAIHYDLVLAAGSDERDPPGTPHYLASTLSFVALKQVSSKRFLGIGLDVFYDQSVKARMITDSIPFHSDLDAIRSGIYFDHELVLGRTSVIVQIGVYIIDNYKRDGAIYDRFGYKYRFTKNLFANLTLKAHYAKADFIEWGIGVKI